MYDLNSSSSGVLYLKEAAIAAGNHRSDITEFSGMCRQPVFSDDEDEQDDDFTAASGRQRHPPPSKGAAIAPPSVLLEDTAIDPGIPSADGTGDVDDSQVTGASSKFGINVVAAKMMARMGYREGQGLGRESQGMSTALVVEKTSRRGGKIIHERDQQRQQQSTQQQPLNSLPIPDTAAEEIITELPLPENRSCVILLRNMCGPGEVDDDLEPETAEECAKYGKVISCLIFELPDASDDEAVRIFVEFDSDDAATKVSARGKYYYTTSDIRMTTDIVVLEYPQRRNGAERTTSTSEIHLANGQIVSGRPKLNFVTGAFVTLY
ncbi:splicing factor 45 [Paragonimus westermani]|uniref:Splicing factor 45 n=1 Tax=Paragonimus westermani TaxID=34504 RepID=A0A5J4NXG2_9TREM|nr:splicing factor 45 [Paragonimus westermani]